MLGQEYRVAEFVLKRIRTGGMWHGFAAIGVERGGEMCAGVVYHDWNPAAGDIRISAAFDGADWYGMRRPLRAILHYPLVQLQARRATMMISETNTRARAFAVKLGFQLEGRMRKGHDGAADRLVYGVLRDEFLANPMVAALFATQTTKILGGLQ